MPRRIALLLAAVVSASCGMLVPSAEDLRNDPHGHLVWAARRGDVAAIRRLAARGVDLDASSCHQTHIHLSRHRPRPVDCAAARRAEAARRSRARPARMGRRAGRNGAWQPRDAPVHRRQQQRSDHGQVAARCRRRRGLDRPGIVPGRAWRSAMACHRTRAGARARGPVTEGCRSNSCAPRPVSPDPDSNPQTPAF